MPSSNDPVRVVEVGPRDGLQNIQPTIPTALKILLIKRLHEAGMQTIEMTSTVSPYAVPQLADSHELLANADIQAIVQNPAVRAPVLVPNLQGLRRAMGSGVREVAVFVSASEGFSKANIKCSVQQGLDRGRQVAEEASKHGIAVRGYVSCVFACPFDGPTSAAATLHCVQQLLDMGCYEISLGDTTGVGVPADVEKLVCYLLKAKVPVDRLAGHFHDTYGQAIANVWAAYRCGLRVFDSSVGGLGGCPFAPGAKGNLATEDLVYSLHQAGIETGANLPRLVEIGAWISRELSLPNSSRAGAALSSIKGIPTKRSIQKTIAQGSKMQWVLQPSPEGLQVFRSGTNIKIVLNRPKNGNALTAGMISSVVALFEAAASDPTITRIAIAANGRFFCTGKRSRHFAAHTDC